MAAKKLHPRTGALWALARRQHGVVTRAQLLDLGLSSGAIRHRLRVGRLHPVRQGVYAVGRPELNHLGQWTAAVLSCGPHALLAGRSAAALWGIGAPGEREIEVVVPSSVLRRRSGIKLRRQAGLEPSSRSSRKALRSRTSSRR